MQPGDVVVDRFEIERLAGVGGMGEVWRARDRLSNSIVALKKLTGGGDPSRFMREAALLSDLRHPGIVRYVAHGVTPQDELYLAMEWLEGGDLSQRLLDGALGVPGTVTMLKRTASALAMAHTRGIVHRDIKPSNLFLPSGSIDGIKVLDFGIARTEDATRTRTATGSVLGSPGYMAPEQARGEKDIDARVDVFALGCVTYECLTGRRAFDGDSLIAVLAKVLLEDAPSAHELVADLPPALEKLLSRMLAKDRDRRPESAAAIVAELGALRDLGLSDADNAIEAAKFSGRRRALTPSEQRMMGIVLAAPPKMAPRDGGTIADGMLPDAERQEEVRLLVERHGANAAWLADGSLLATVGKRGAATDLAAQSARCALALRVMMPDRLIALTMARSESSMRVGGEAIDHTTRILLRDGNDGDGASSARIVVDDVMAGLLGNRFDIVASEKGLILKGERVATGAARTLLGKPVTMVGRDREVSGLEATLAECIEEPVARVAVIIAGAGYGKSRLWNEFVDRAKKVREDDDVPLAVWIGRGDPMKAGSPFSLVADALRNATGILDGEPVEIRRRKLQDAVARHVPEPERVRVAEFLGEITGTHFPDDASVQLRAARNDASLMSDQMQRAWEDFVAAECKANPLLIVLEDLHWGDLPTVKLVDAILRNLADSPLMVLASARPEVSELFPRIWAERGAQEIRLGGLTKKACEKLIQQVLGATVAAPLMATVIERADGNAFYLEELIREVAAGRGATLPDSLVAMIQTRLETLDLEARRVLRCGSVFGQTFWSGGIEALSGGVAQLADWLRDLLDQEMVSKRAPSQFPGEDENAFRQALLREGAYAMLTKEDRVLGHSLAGDWLERMGETDAVLLAEHFDRGGQPERALKWFPRAALQALEGNDLQGALQRAARGIACGAKGEQLGELRLIEAEARNWLGENAESERLATEAMSLLPPGSANWYAAAREAMITSLKAGNIDRVVEIASSVKATPPLENAHDARRTAMAWASMDLVLGGRYQLVAEILEELQAATVVGDPRTEALVIKARALWAVIEGKPEAVELLTSALASFEAAGDLRNTSSTRADLGFVLMSFGAWDDADRMLRQSLSEAERLGLRTIIPQIKHNLGYAMMGAATDLAEAARVEAEAVEEARLEGAPRFEGLARTYLALIHLRSGDLAKCEAEAVTACELLKISPGSRAMTLAVLALGRLASSKNAEALHAAKEAIELLRTLGNLEEGETLVRLAYARALHASGDVSGAKTAIIEARDALLARAEKIADQSRRASFLERVEENVQTLNLAREVLAGERQNGGG